MPEEFDIYYVSGHRQNGFESHLLRRMSFKKDFILALYKLGTMPFSTVEEALQHREIERLLTEEKIRKEMEGLPK